MHERLKAGAASLSFRHDVAPPGASREQTSLGRGRGHEVARLAQYLVRKNVAIRVCPGSLGRTSHQVISCSFVRPAA